MKKILSFLLMFLFFCLITKAQDVVNGQTIKRCGTEDADQILRDNDPVYKADRENLEKYVQKWIEDHPNYDTKVQYTIPVVVHVLYVSSSDANCISYSQVVSQIMATNVDWSGVNTHSMYSFSSSLKANTGVEFCLATKDPSGNTTNGVDYKQTTVASFGPTGSPQNCSGYPERCSSSGGADAWDVTKYFNVWVCKMSDPNLCGISEFPKLGSNNNYYGSTINYLYFGTIGTATSPYNLGGTLSHEAGHCFNLYHTWGDRSGQACSVTTYPGSDLCSDTPPQYTATSGHHTGVLTDACTTSSPGIMYEDFMDYSDDMDYACFTPDQVLRIKAIATGVNASLTTSHLCTVGINEIDAISNVSIYPNPSNGIVNVIFDNSNANNKITITVNNLLGEMVSEIEKENVSSVNIPIDLSEQSAGVYYIKIQSGNSILTKKLVLLK